MARQVIIGNSAAGLSAIQAIREAEPRCQITLISSETGNAYSPVLLTYYLNGKIPRAQLFIVDDNFYRDMGVKLLSSSTALSVDTRKRCVRLNTGRDVEYDNLLIATGASPIILGHPEEAPDKLFSLRSIDDTERILRCSEGSTSAVVIGSGLIGMQVSDALVKRMEKVTIVEWAGQVLPESIDHDCASIVQKEIESHGVSVKLGWKVKELRSSGNGVSVVSETGEELTADMAVIAVGLKANAVFLNGTGVEVSRGLVVDEKMRTNVDGIFAAGDVTQGRNLVTGKNQVLPTWSNARRQGRIAGFNIAGQARSYEGGLRETVTMVFGLTVAAVGLAKSSEAEGVTEVRFLDVGSKVYRKVLYREGKVVGAVLLNRTSDAGILGSLIRSGRDASHWAERIASSPLTLRETLVQAAVR
jgi:NAD(P)H-nitrite reductase large subunit